LSCFFLEFGVVVEEFCEGHVDVAGFSEEGFVLAFQGVGYFLFRALDSLYACDDGDGTYYVVLYAEFLRYALCMCSVWFGVV
jgi:hypothetical protein